MSDKGRSPENMTTKLNVVLVGCGKMSKYLIESIHRKGANVVAVFDIDQANLDEQLSKIEPNCVVIATNMSLENIQFILSLCVWNNINTVVACNGMLHLSSPFRMELDRLAKINYSTVLEVGYMRGAYYSLIEEDNLQDKEVISDLIVDRIVDCINSPSGFISANLMEPVRRYNRALHEYILI